MEKMYKGNNRKFTGGGRRPDRSEQKQKEAKERDEAWKKLTPEQQLKILEKRPGESKRQRARIQSLIEKRKSLSTAAPATKPASQEEAKEKNIKAKERRASEQAKRTSK